MKLPLLLLSALLATACTTAQAQWQWTDRQGKTVFSDRAPPADIPERNIIRRPGERTRALATPEASPPAVPTNRVNEGTPTGKQPEPKESPVETAQRQAEEARLALLRADNCNRARQAMAGIQSGVRIARTNAQGEREFLDEAGRAEEAQRIQRVIDADCR